MKPKSNFDAEERRNELWELLATHSLNASHECPNKPPKPLTDTLNELLTLDHYWAYPGAQVRQACIDYTNQKAYARLEQLTKNVTNTLKNNHHRRQEFIPFKTNIMQLDEPHLYEEIQLTSPTQTKTKKPYFEVLVVHPDPLGYDDLYRNSLSIHKTDKDEFLYDILFVTSIEDAIIACLANPSIQSIVMVNGFSIKTNASHPLLKDYLTFLPDSNWADNCATTPILELNALITRIRPEIDQYYISETPPHELDITLRQKFTKILFHINPFHDLHLSILNGIRNRFTTPFFNALQAYSRKPKGVFHALPLSRGKSIQNSHWIQDMLEFYGSNIFLAETSSTQGGLDSLLDPKGAIKQSHNKAAKSFGAQQTYFVTNGTSTSNKIVMQSLLKPGDIVLISSDCHKSISYSVMLSGAYPIFLETYPLDTFDLYGAVTLTKIKTIMLNLKKSGQLDRLKHITLTNSTFDGLIYNTKQFMMDILSIKPDIIFHWDEAWFSFAHFNPVYKDRTAMAVTNKLRTLFASPEYKKTYQNWKKEFDKKDQDDIKTWTQNSLLPDPDKITLRAYATQSTHKTLSSFRQGSMIHINDDAFDQENFLEAYRMHTSTSPNYQIIASLDIARRQADLEGYERIKTTLRLAQKLRDHINHSPTLKPYFKALTEDELIPKELKETPKTKTDHSTYTSYHPYWLNSEFIVDPTRITVDIQKTGMDGSSFRQLLINKYDIQVNKTSRNTVLFIINIGSTKATINYLTQVLHEVAELLDQQKQQAKKPLLSLGTPDEQPIKLPQIRKFHPAFIPIPNTNTNLSDIRTANYYGFEEKNVTYAHMDTDLIKEVLNGKVIVSASFVTPYPPGFPVLAPGQIITYDILMTLKKLKIKEIHGYNSEKGLKIFKQSLLDQLKETNTHV